MTSSSPATTEDDLICRLRLENSTLRGIVLDFLRRENECEEDCGRAADKCGCVLELRSLVGQRVQAAAEDDQLFLYLTQADRLVHGQEYWLVQRLFGEDRQRHGSAMADRVEIGRYSAPAVDPIDGSIAAAGSFTMASGGSIDARRVLAFRPLVRPALPQVPAEFLAAL